MLKPLNFSARPVVHFSCPARPVIQFFILGPFGPVWASENILSSMFYNKTTTYLVLTDLQRPRLDFGSREEHTAKTYSTETLKNFIYKLAYWHKQFLKNFIKFKIILNNKIINFF